MRLIKLLKTADILFFWIICIFFGLALRQIVSADPPTDTPERAVEGSRIACLAHGDVNTHLLTRNAFFEARSESDDGILAIWYVVMSRISDKRYPSTFYEVIYQKKQFSWTHTIAYDTQERLISADKRAYNRVHELMKQAYCNYFYGSKRDIKHLTHYHTTAIKPKWAVGKVGMVIGNHVFYSNVR